MKLKPCKTCGHMIAQNAQLCPNCGQKYSHISGCFSFIMIFLFASMLIGFIINAFYNKSPQEYSKQTPKDDISVFISKYGEPDQIKSSENEKPRPPIVTKQLIYKKENVRAVYVPAGTPPPYHKWELVGFQDNHTNKVLTPEEVALRLARRKKK